LGGESPPTLFEEKIMSFQKAHSISNKLGEVLVTTPPINLITRQTDWVNPIGTYVALPSPAVSGRSYRVLEVGCTVQTAGTAVNANHITAGTATDPDAFVQLNSANLPATTPLGTTYSTSQGGADTWSFRASGSGNIDSDGVPFLSAGEQIVFTVDANVANSPHVIFFARLAPVIARDIFV
jgi:hypothetical protein